MMGCQRQYKMDGLRCVGKPADKTFSTLMIFENINKGGRHGMQNFNLYQISCDDLNNLIRQAVTDVLQGLIVHPKPDPEIRYLTGEEVDALCHITPMTRNNWAKKGLLKKYKVGRRVLFREDEVHAALAEEVPMKYRRVNRGAKKLSKTDIL